MIILQVRGGLGNQMFEYAFARNLSLRNGNEKIILYIENFKYDDLRNFSLSNLCLNNHIKVIKKSIPIRLYCKFFRTLARFMKIKFSDGKGVLRLYRWGFFEYLGNSEFIELPKCRAPIKYFSSIFLNEQYFMENRDSIKKELLVKTDPSKENQEMMNRIASKQDSVCIHIRRGDYLTKQKYLVCTDQYYKEAVSECERIVSNPFYFVFSEDIEYARSLQLANENICYVDLNNPDYEELRLMYQCRHFVISNSTFSWWAQYLARDKGIVVSPKYWGKAETQVSQLVSENWILISPAKETAESN